MALIVSDLFLSFHDKVLSRDTCVVLLCCDVVLLCCDVVLLYFDVVLLYFDVVLLCCDVVLLCCDVVLLYCDLVLCVVFTLQGVCGSKGGGERGSESVCEGGGGVMIMVTVTVGVTVGVRGGRVGGGCNDQR